MGRALVLLASGVLDGEALVTDVNPLSNLPEVALSGRPGKHLFDCGDLGR
jgi:hypothetical protein